ncbi:Gfo/Idh/MocA family oxidoreductase [Paenibacillus filicis]|uniref:Gfo/Idh/MocA family oxidoreductase n=1 Tax=Paenibacillus gyeongsangnamensis TaxID=3388067 RepID=A0ABT4QFL9_9BACL|nr:Gfo/Idh/MocA family oxidoreductase [Paenibacillus filicis]MCZ8515666.1 Gfo/Idh/MocA family oxidoreductase [Paenibacillus filicis]
MKPRIGIIGLGDIAQKVYLPLLSAHPETVIAGIASRSSATVERLAAQYRTDRCYTLKELLDRKPDAVFVHTPTETHEEIVMACLRSGTAVYVDKPLSYDDEASRRMAQTALDRGVLLGVGFNRRFAPMYVKTKAWLEEAGGFDLAVASKHRTRLQPLPAKQTLYDDLIHMLDLLVWLGGDDYEVSEYRQRTDEEGRLLIGAGSLSWDRERTGQFSMVRRAGSDLEKLELHGSLRSAEVVNLEQAVWAEPGRNPETLAFGSWDTILERRGFAGIVNHYLSTLRRPEECTVRADRVLASHRLAQRLASG